MKKKSNIIVIICMFIFIGPFKDNCLRKVAWQRKKVVHHWCITWYRNFINRRLKLDVTELESYLKCSFMKSYQDLVIMWFGENVVPIGEINRHIRNTVQFSKQTVS